MEERLGIQKNKGASRIIMTLVMFFVLMASIFLVSCSSGNITITYKTILDQERGFVVKKGSTIAELGEAEPVTGYTFEGWYKDQAFYARYGNEEKLEKDITIYAKYLPNKYKVVFHSNNGLDETDVYTHEFNSTFKLATNTFTLDHYTFVGWSKDKNDVEGSNTIEAQGKEVQLTTEGADYYAIWASNDIAIEYNFDDALLDGEAIETANLQNEVKYNTMLTLPTFSGTITKVGDDLNDYTFAGFKIGEVVYEAGRKVNVTAAIMENETITISIEWISVNEGLASFNLNKPVIDQKEISGIASIHLERDENDNFVFTLPSCENLYGHAFLGWSVGGTDEVFEAGEQYTTTRSLTTFYAVWQAQQRTITLVDGETTVATIETTYGEQITLPSTGSPAGDYTRTDRWRFDGWKKELPEAAPTTNYSGQLAVVANASNNYLFESSSLTLYASYYRKQVTLEFIANGGDGAIENIAVNTADTYTVTPATYNKLSRLYYSLVGFSTNSNVAIGSFAIDVGTSDMTLFAIWSRNQITISYDNEESTVPTDFQMDQGSYLTFSGNGLEKSGYRLIGFKIDGDTSDVVYQVGQQVFLTENTTLIPQWTDLDYINFRGVGYDAGVKPTVVKSDGTTSSTTDLAVGDEIILPTYSTANDSYVDENGTRLYFAGWSKEQNAEAPSYFANSKYVVNNNVDVDIFYPVFMPATLSALSFTLDTSNNTATVKYNGGSLSAGNILIYPNIYVENGITYQVSVLDTLTSSTTTKKPTTAQHVILAEGITTIGSYSFYNCTSVTDALIPTSTTTIMAYAFSGCQNVNVITIPQNVTTFGNYAFGSTYRLTNINYNAANASALTTSSHLFYDSGKYVDGITALFGSSVTAIPTALFYTNSSYKPKLTKVIISDSVTTINGSVFRDCSSLTNVHIGSGVTSFANYTFQNCTSLTSVRFPDSVTAIGNNTFNGCSNLVSVEFGENLQTLGSNTFNNCTKLESITVNPNNTSFSSAGNCFVEIATATLIKGFNNSIIPIDGSVTVISVSAFKDCTGLTTITIPESVTTIGASAFNGCTGLTTINYNATSVSNLTSSSYVFSNAGKNGNGITVTFGDNVTSIPSYLFHSSTTSTPNIKNVIIGNGVKTIGDRAFINNKDLVNLTIGSSVETISEYSFYCCTGITNLTIPESVTNIGRCAFSGCSSLTNLEVNSNNQIYHSSGNCLIETQTRTLIEGFGNSVIPTDGSVTIIGDYAFYGCKELTSLTIPNPVTTIKTYAFHSCSNLTSVTFADSVTTIGERAFQSTGLSGTLELPAGLTIIGNYAFLNLSKLTGTLNLPSNLTTIGQYAFSGCNGLESVTIPNSVTSVGKLAFQNCTGLTSVSFLGGNVTMEESVFSGCTGLTSVTLNSSNIGSGAFINCTNLTTINIGPNLTSIQGGAFRGCSSLVNINIDPDNTSFIYASDCLINTTTKTLVMANNNSVIPNDGSVTKIADYVFYDRTGLTSLILPDGLTSIGNYAFSRCTGLTTLTLPAGVTSIGNYAFQGCSGLTSLTLSAALTTIGSYAFGSCTGLTTLTLPNNLTSIGTFAFYECTSLTSLTIPEGVTKIENGTFKYCYVLAELNLPSTLTKFDNACLHSCVELKNGTEDAPRIHYNGTSAQFNAILQRTRVEFEIPGTTKKDRGTYKFYVECTDETILTELNYVLYIGPY